MNRNKQINLSSKLSQYPRKTAITLVSFAVGLIILGITVQVYEYFFADYISKILHKDFDTVVDLFNLNSEGNLPTWFSSFMLLLTSGLLAIIAVIKNFNSDPFKLNWRLMSFVFLLLSIDELCSIHEIFGYHFHSVIKPIGFLYFSWVVFGAAFVLLFILYNFKFLFSLDSKTRKLFIVAGMLYVGGALIMEMAAGNYIYLHGSNIISTSMSIFEESLEMIGIIVFNYALMSYGLRYIRELHIELLKEQGLIAESEKSITEQPELLQE